MICVPWNLILTITIPAGLVTTPLRHHLLLEKQNSHLPACGNITRTHYFHATPFLICSMSGFWKYIIALMQDSFVIDQPPELSGHPIASWSQLALNKTKLGYWMKNSWCYPHFARSNDNAFSSWILNTCPPGNVKLQMQCSFTIEGSVLIATGTKVGWLFSSIFLSQ